MALAGINGVEKFIHMILGVELEMRISEEEREDDVYYRSSLEVLRSHWITHRRLAEFRKFLLHKLLVGPWQATRPMPMTAQAQVPVTLCSPSLILLSQCPLSPHTHTHTYTKGYKMQVIWSFVSKIPKIRTSPLFFNWSISKSVCSLILSPILFNKWEYYQTFYMFLLTDHLPQYVLSTY